MALFSKLIGKSSRENNKTIYSKQTYNITGKRALEEPRYLFITASYIEGWTKPYCHFPEFDKNLDPDFLRHIALIMYPSMVLIGDRNGGNSKKVFVGECVTSGLSTTYSTKYKNYEYQPTSDGSNDIIILHFQISWQQL